MSDIGRHEEAIAELERARQLDPVSPSIIASLGDALQYARRYDRAIEELRKAFELDPGIPFHASLAWYYEATGRPYEAVREYTEYVRTRFGATPEQIAAYRQAYASSALAGARRWFVAYLEAEAEHRGVSAYDIAAQYALLGETDLAFEWLEKAFEQHDAMLPYLLVDAAWDDSLTLSERTAEH